MCASRCYQLNEGVNKLTRRKPFCDKILFLGRSVAPQGLFILFLFYGGLLVIS